MSSVEILNLIIIMILYFIWSEMGDINSKIDDIETHSHEDDF